MKTFQKPRGTRDFLPEEMRTRRKVENILRDVIERYGFEEIYTPTFEQFELISQKAGDEIRNTMYIFKDKKDRELALRAEGTPSATRVFIDEFRTRTKPVKFYYIYPMFRYDRPQFGRFRESFQFGIEMFGADSVQSDVEILSCVIDAYKVLGFEDFKLKLGDIGIYRHVLSVLDETHQNKWISYLDNPNELIKSSYLDIAQHDALSRKIEALSDLKGVRGLAEASQIVPDYDTTLFNQLMNALKYLNLDKYIDIDFSIARGIDYYTGLVFEVFVPELDIAIGAGGRYDNLVETFGGPKSPAIGFGFGFDRIMIALEKINSPLLDNKKPNIDVFVANVSNALAVRLIVKDLRDAGLKVEYNILNKPLKKQLSFASAKKIPYVIIVGEEEEISKKYKLKNMNTQEEETLELPKIIDKITSSKK